MASSIVSSVAKELGSLAAKEVNSLYQVKDKIERLQRDMIWMRYFLEDADNKQHRQKVVGFWVSEIRDFAYEAQDIVEKYLHQVSHHRQNGKWNTVKWLLCCMCDAKVLHDVGSQIDAMRRRISELIYNLQLCGVKISDQLESLEYNLAMRERRRTYSHTKEDPVGLKKCIEDVVGHLVSKNEVSVVGIYGIGGSGKTTLARQVFKNEIIKKHFETNCAWVYISKFFERKNIFKEILLGLSKSIEGENGRTRVKELTEDDLPREIKKVLNDKKCLVVLDDMWETRDWDTLQPAFELINGSSSKILITTRKMSLVQHAHGHQYPIKFLDEENSWKLLEGILFLQGESPGNKERASSHDTKSDRATSKDEGQDESPTLEMDPIDQTKLQGNAVDNKKKLANEMLKHCNGIPLAITTLGGVLLSKKTLSEWEAVQENISYYLMNSRKEERGNQGLSALLESSYYDLPYYLKPCFLYMGIFPENYEIEAEDLFHLWEAEGLVTSSHDDEDEHQEVLLDDIAQMYLNQLVERSMVQVEKCWPNGKIKSCRLHDIMRDMCLKKCKEGNFLSVIQQKSSTESSNPTARAYPLNRRMRRCALHDSGHLDSLVDPDLSNNTPCIRSLMVFATEDSAESKLVSENKRKFLSLLRVLYISSKADIPHAQRMVRDFIHLRFLRLGTTGFGGTEAGNTSASLICLDLPLCFWECKYLETLDLRECSIDGCSNKFWKLERLRHLYLPKKLSFKDSEKLRLSTNQLQQIESLKNFDVQCCEIEDLQKMKNLRNFSFRGKYCVDEKALDVLLKSPVIKCKRHVELFKLTLNAQMINDPSILTHFEAMFIEELEVEGRIDGSVVDLQVLFRDSLEKVTLKYCEISAEGVAILGKLPRLKYLDLFSNAIEGNSMIFSDGSFPCLHRLDLCDMENLEHWNLGKGALPSLRLLSINVCPNLKDNPKGLRHALPHCQVEWLM